MIFHVDVIRSVMGIQGRTEKSIKNEDVLDTVVDLSAKLERAEAELVKLRPPEAKFNVYQVVMFTTEAGFGNFAPVKIVDRRYDNLRRCWEYKGGYANTWHEERLFRPLLDEERQ